MPRPHRHHVPPRPRRLCRIHRKRPPPPRMAPHLDPVHINRRIRPHPLKHQKQSLPVPHLRRHLNLTPIPRRPMQIPVAPLRIPLIPLPVVRHAHRLPPRIVKPHRLRPRNLPKHRPPPPINPLPPPQLPHPLRIKPPRPTHNPRHIRTPPTPQGNHHPHPNHHRHPHPLPNPHQSLHPHTSHPSTNFTNPQAGPSHPGRTPTKSYKTHTFQTPSPDFPRCNSPPPLALLLHLPPI